MRRLLPLCLLFTSLATAQSTAPVVATAPTAPTTTIVEPPTPLLPTSARLQAVASAGVTPELEQILKEDGLQRTEARTGAAGEVQAWQFVDATGAYSFYTYLRQGGHPAPGRRVNPTEVRLSDGHAVVLQGTSVVRAQLHETADLAAVVSALPKIGGPKGQPPLLPHLLPTKGLDLMSIRYALGPVSFQTMGGVLPGTNLGWEKSAESATATYSGRGGKGTLTLLLYPTPQIAGDRGRMIEQFVNAEGAGKLDAGKLDAGKLDAGKLDAGKLGTVKMRRVGPLLGIATGAFTAEQAQTLMNELRLHEEISFDKPMPLEFHAEVRKTASLLENIGVLCGVLILAAVLLGVFLGGARAGIRVLQGKPAASEPEFLTINLRDVPGPQDKPASAAESEEAPPKP